MNKHFLLLLSLIFICQTGFSQDSIQWASPNVKYQPFGRGLDFNFTRIYTSSIESESEVSNVSDNSAKIKSIDNIEYDLKVPIVIRDRSQFIIGLEYTYDYFDFNDSENLQYEFYERINNRQLRSRKLKMYYVHSFDERKYINIRASAALNGDVAESSKPIYEFAKYTLAVTYGWQKSATNSYGIGLYFDYNLGTPTIYPVFAWNKSWNEKWGFESKLPAKFMLRYTPYSGMRIYGGYDVNGISYRVVAENENTTLLEEYEIRRSDVKFKMSLEKRIYDFLWFGVEGGINYNVKVDVSDEKQFYKNEDIITSNLETAPYVNFSIFILPTDGLKQLVGFKK